MVAAAGSPARSAGCFSGVSAAFYKNRAAGSAGPFNGSLSKNFSRCNWAFPARCISWHPFQVQHNTEKAGTASPIRRTRCRCGNFIVVGDKQRAQGIGANIVSEYCNTSSSPLLSVTPFQRSSSYAAISRHSWRRILVVIDFLAFAARTGALFYPAPYGRCSRNPAAPAWPYRTETRLYRILYPEPMHSIMVVRSSGTS